MLRYAFCGTPMGILKLGHENDKIVLARLVAQPDEAHTPSPVTELAALQFREYFEGTRQCFDFPFSFNATPFQAAVWNALRTIPYGQVRTYAQIAADIGKPKAFRAVGRACNQNPIWIAIPCHRVIGSSHSLTGYAGGIELKQHLLALEQANR